MAPAASNTPEKLDNVFIVLTDCTSMNMESVRISKLLDVWKNIRTDWPAITVLRVLFYFIPEFVLSHGKCLKKVPNCWEYNSDGTCYSCEEGFDLIDGVCVGDNIYDEECEFPFSLTSEGQCWVEGCD